MVSVFAVLQAGQVSVDSRTTMTAHAKMKPNTVSTAPTDSAPASKAVITGGLPHTTPGAQATAARRRQSN
jgi:hypothetical protein